MSDDNATIASAKPWDAARVARWSGTLGVALPAISIAAYPIWSVPGTQTSGSDVAQWATANHDRLVAMTMLDTAGVALWLVFGAAVWTYLRNRLPAGSMLPACFAAGFIGFVILILSGFTAFDLLLYRHRGAESSTLLYDLCVGLLAMSGMPTIVALAAFAVAVYIYRVLPRSTAHYAVAAVAAHLLLPAAFIAQDGPFSLQGVAIVTVIPVFLFAWIFATARAMPRDSDNAG